MEPADRHVSRLEWSPFTVYEGKVTQWSNSLTGRARQLLHDDTVCMIAHGETTIVLVGRYAKQPVSQTVNAPLIRV